MKEIRNISYSADKKYAFMLSFILVALIATLSFWMVKAAGDGYFFLSHEDEVIYYCSGRLFAETNSIQAEGCIKENVSAIGNMNWYGPGFNIVYGTLFKVFGDAPSIIPWFNFVLALGMLAVFFLLPVSLEKRLLMAICLCLTPQFCVYIFTYFPETLIMFLATVLTVLLTLYFFSENKQTKKKYLIAFICCTVLFMLCRITFIFWLAALIGMAENKKSFFLYTSFFLGGVIVSLVYMKLFTAPPYAPSMYKIDLLYQGQILNFINETQDAALGNLKLIFQEQTLGFKILLGLMITLTVSFFLTRNRLALGSFLVACCLICVMLAYYVGYHFYFDKQTAMLIPLLLVSAYSSISWKLIQYVAPVLLAINFDSGIKEVNQRITDGRAAFQHYIDHADFVKSLAEIPDYIQPENTNILYSYNEFEFGNTAEAVLPFATKAKNPILYTTNINSPEETAERKFEMHNKLKIHYVLSRYPLSWPQLKLLRTTEYYNLYLLVD